MYRYMSQPAARAPRMTIRAEMTSTAFLTEVANVNVGQILKSEVNKAASLVINRYRATVPRSAVNTLHLADSLGKRARIYRNRNGAYVVIGEKIVNGRTMVKNFHVQEKGSTLRFRKRIGGKYAWVEQVLSENTLKYKRQTGMVVGQHYLQRAFESQVEPMARQVADGFLNTVLRSWTGRHDRAGLNPVYAD